MAWARLSELTVSELRAAGDPDEESASKRVRQIANTEKLELIAESIEQKLRAEKIEGFSVQAAIALTEGQAAYVRELAESAVDLAKSDGLDVISEEHIRRARRNLRKADVSTFQNALTIAGGALLGTSAQEVFNILSMTGQLNKQSVLLTMLMLAIGVALVVIALIPRRRD